MRKFWVFDILTAVHTLNLRLNKSHKIINKVKITSKSKEAKINGCHSFIYLPVSNWLID